MSRKIYNEKSDYNIIDIPHEDLIDVIPFGEDFSHKDLVVLVSTYDVNGKVHHVVCSDMQLAKQLYPNAQKNLVPYFNEVKVDEFI